MLINFRLVVAKTALWVAKQYLRLAPWKRGHGFIKRRVLPKFFPGNGASFAAEIANGVALELEYREELAITTLLEGSYEQHEIDFVLDHFKDDSVFIDVGANVGLFTVAAAKRLGETGCVVAFEPLPRNISKLKRNIDINSLDNVIVIPKAVGSQRGTARMYIKRDPAYGSLVARALEGDAKKNHVIDVEVVTLDEVCSTLNLGRIDLVKIDVEGFELEVLKGATECLKCYSPTLLIEANSEQELHKLMEFLKPYRYTCLHPTGFKPWNYIFLKVKENEETYSDL